MTTATEVRGVTICASCRRPCHQTIARLTFDVVSECCRTPFHVLDLGMVECGEYDHTLWRCEHERRKRMALAD